MDTSRSASISGILGIDCLVCRECGRSIFTGPPDDPYDLQEGLRRHKCYPRMSPEAIQADLVRLGLYNTPAFSKPAPLDLGVTVLVSAIPAGEQFLHLGKTFLKCVSIKGRQLAIELLDGRNGRWYTGEVFSLEPNMMVEKV